MSQLLDQSVRHAAYLERYKSGAWKDYLKLLDDMERSIRAEISTPTTDWNLNRLKRQLSVVTDTIKSAGVDYRNLIKGQILDLSNYEAEFEIKSLGNVVAGYDFNIPSDAQIQAAVYSTPLQVNGPYQGSLLDSFIEGWSDTTARKVTGAIRLGFAQGKPTQKIISELMAHGGALVDSRRDMESIVRTGLAHTANAARQEVWNENSSVVKMVRISATLDIKTSSTCRSVDGQVHPIDKGPRPPFHIRCRTTTTAVLSKKYDFLDKGRTRAARNPETGEIEKVAHKTTYYSWLKRQPADVQDSIVGKTRGKLLRNGGISAERFAELQIGKNYEPLTLLEMRKLEPLAFQKANL